MAERQGEVRNPEDRPNWGKEFFQLISPQGQQALEDALRLYAPYTSDEIEQNPELAIKIAREVRPHLETAVAALLENLKRRFITPQGILQASIDEINLLFINAFGPKYPESIPEGVRFSEAFIFNELSDRINGYLVATMALKEQQHRKLTRRTLVQRDRIRGNDYRQIPVHGNFFNIVDYAESIQDPRLRPGVFLANPLALKFHDVTHTWVPLLKKQERPLYNPNNLSTETLKKENDRITALLFQYATKELGGTLVEESTTLFGDTDPVAMQFHPTDQSMGQFSNTFAQVTYFPPDYGSALREDEEGQRAFRAFRVENILGRRDMDLSLSVEGYPSGFLTRFLGEFTAPALPTDALKLIAGDAPTYELLRRDALTYITQFLCSPEVLEMMYGAAFAPRRKRPARQIPSPQIPGNPAAPDKSTVADRQYPTDGRELTLAEKLAIIRAIREGKIEEAEQLMGNDETSEEMPEDLVASVEEQVESQVRRTKDHPVTGHPYMLRLVKTRRPDGTFKITSPRPSPQGLALAAAAEKPLRTGVEFVSTGLVVKPPELPQVFADNGVNNLEEFLALFPDDAYPCHQGWISSHRRGDPEIGRIATISAHVREVTKTE